MKSPGWGQRTGLAYAGYCEWEARDAKGEAEEDGLESWGRLQGWRETFPAQRRVGMTVAEVEDKARLPLTPQWGRKESDMTELTVTLYYNFSSVNFSQRSLTPEIREEKFFLVFGVYIK